MSYGIAPSTVAEYEQRAEDAERSPLPWILKAAKVIVWVDLRHRPADGDQPDAGVLPAPLRRQPRGGVRRVGVPQRRGGHATRSAASSRPHELGGTSVLDTSLLFAAVVYFVLALLDRRRACTGSRGRLQRQECGDRQRPRPGRRCRAGVRRPAAQRRRGGTAGRRARVRRPAGRGAAVRRRPSCRPGGGRPTAAHAHATDGTSADRAAGRRPAAAAELTVSRTVRRKRPQIGHFGRIVRGSDRVRACRRRPGSRGCRSSCRASWRCARTRGSAGSTRRGRGTSHRA